MKNKHAYVRGVGSVCYWGEGREGGEMEGRGCGVGRGWGRRVEGGGRVEGREVRVRRYVLTERGVGCVIGGEVSAARGDLGCRRVGIMCMCPGSYDLANTEFSPNTEAILLYVNRNIFGPSLVCA